MKIDALFCDDIRPEASGKQILIGVYPNDLVSHASPAKFPLAVWIRLSGSDTTNEKFEIKIKSDDGATDLGLNGDISTNDMDAPSVIALGGLPITVTGPTTLRATLKLGDKEPIEIATLPIKVNENPLAHTKLP